MNELKHIELVMEKTGCCGCCLCQAVCPVGAIKMKRDEEGFLYPKINELQCVECKLCIKSCIMRANPAKKTRKGLLFS